MDGWMDGWMATNEAKSTCATYNRLAASDLGACFVREVCRGTRQQGHQDSESKRCHTIEAANELARHDVALALRHVARGSKEH